MNECEILGLTKMKTPVIIEVQRGLAALPVRFTSCYISVHHLLQNYNAKMTTLVNFLYFHVPIHVSSYLATT